MKVIIDDHQWSYCPSFLVFIRKIRVWVHAHLEEKSVSRNILIGPENFQSLPSCPIYSILWDEKAWTMKFCHISYFRTLNCTRVFSWLVLLLWTSPTTLGINGTPFVLAMNRLKIGQSCIKSVFLCSKVKLKSMLYKTKVSRKNKIIAFQKKWIALAISREKQSILVHGPVWASKMK